jgi:tRNA(fMet)-specific endonuclease VapC
VHLDDNSCRAFIRGQKIPRRHENRRAVDGFTARLDVLPFTAEAAHHYGQIRAELERMGRPIGAHDMLIGAHARSAALIIVTNNFSEFERIHGLRVENWVKGL